MTAIATMVPSSFIVMLAQAATTTAAPAPQPSWGPFVPLVFMGIIFYFLLIRPQQKRAKEQAALISSVKSGDRVVTSGGLHGIVANARSADDKTVLVKFAENVKLEVERSAITSVAKGNGNAPEPDTRTTSTTAAAALPASKVVS